MRLILGTTGVVLCLCMGACKRGAEGSESRAPAAGPTSGQAVGPSAGVQPGIHPQMLLGTRVTRNPYAGDRSAIATGRQLFLGMNCAGCHSTYGGGAIGPSLRDSLWIYGSQDAQLFSTIAEGRPSGMPAWGGRLPDDLIWRIVAYIKTLGTPAEPEKPPTPAPTELREQPKSASAGG